MSRVATSDIDRDFHSALSALQIGNLGDAQKWSEAVLRLEPRHFGALNVMAVVLTQLGRFAEAEPYYREALQRQPPSDGTLHNYAIVLKLLNRPAEALQRISQAIGINPSVAEAWNHRGAVFADLNRHEEAIADFDKAAALNGRLPSAWINKGKSLLALGRAEEALGAFDRALAISPELAEPWMGRGHALGRLGNYKEALSAYDRVLALNPSVADAWLGRGHIFSQSQRFADALAAYDRAIALNPQLAEARLARGLLLGAMGNPQGALAAYERALALDPNLAEAWIGRANAFLQLQQYDNALAACDRALALKVNFPEAWSVRGEILVELNEPGKALADFDRALALKGDVRFAQGGRLFAKLLLTDWTNLEAELADLTAAVRADNLAVAPFEFLAMSSFAADQLACARRATADQAPVPPARGRDVYSHDRIRIGYFSADFRAHPVAQLVNGLFDHHDKSRFEINAVSYGPEDGSQLRDRIKAAVDNFVDVRAMTDEDVAEAIHRREIDILVDLTGLTQYNRFGVLSRRAAPIQVNFLGYPGTTAADWIDYIIADRTIIPKNHFDFYSERVVWLPDAYQPNDNKRPISDSLPTRAECNLSDAAFVFCCFNSSFKILPEVFAVWMKLLHEVEDSVLWLLETNPTAMQNLRSEAEARGILPERLVFAPKLPLAEHLSRHRRADLFLDTLPYNAHTTASDALWAGVPIVTRLGETFAGRVAASLLKASGLPELITSSVEDYEALGLKLARDSSFLAGIKAKLARNRDTQPLFDTARFARHIEAAYTTMWERHRNGDPPEAFAV
jgi:protein O-GlcNAc transferase